MTPWTLLLAAALPASAASNELWSWVQSYREGVKTHASDQYTLNWRRDLDPVLKKFDAEPQTFPIVPVAKNLTDRAVAAVGQACRQDPPLSPPERAFQVRVECLWHALVLGYERSPGGIAARALTMPRAADLSRPVSEDAVATSESILDAVAAYRALDGGSINYDDPGGNAAGLLDRAASTGNGQFAPDETIYLVKSRLGAELTSDRGRGPGSEACTARLTLAEVFYHALRAADGSLPVAAGAISGALYSHRPWASCITGLRGSDSEFKDYYRFAGLYIGFQKNPIKRTASSGLAQAQTAAYGAIRQVQYTFTGDPMGGTERAGFVTKFPEFWAGRDAADKVRERLAKP
jgi:hypothetical protein